MIRYLVLRLLIVFCTIMFIKTFVDAMPGYGIKSWWKKLALNVLLSDNVSKISVVEAHAKKNFVLFLDTRSNEEYKVSHIEQARFVGYKDFNLSKISDIPKDQPVVLYCAVGKRSDIISQQLIDAGFTNVRNLYGGIFEWVNQGYEIVNAENAPTNKIHAYNRLFGFWVQKGRKVYS